MLSWLALEAFAKRVATRVITWLGSLSFWQIVCLALACLCVVQHFVLISARHQAVNYRRQFEHEHAGREADRVAYAKAQADAKVLNQSHVQQIERQYQRNSDDERQAYLNDLARLRAERVRHQTAPGSTDGAGPSASPAPAGGVDGDELHLSPDEHLQASEIELRLMHLQNWVEKQLSVNPN